MLKIYDFIVIGGYFVLLLSMGWIYRRFAHDSSEYFRGSGQMAWWLVGASAFMATFSAWTFTGAAGLAYQYGIIVLVIYLSNAVAFVINWWWLAAPCRQMRTVVVMEAVRNRLGKINEQFFTWLTLPLQIVGSAITLYALAIFCSPAFGFELRTGIIISGLVVVFVSAIGGSWAVATGDFLQALVVMSITLVMAVYSLVQVGGIGSLWEKLPRTHFDITASQSSDFGIWWILATVVQQLCGQNSLLGAASRYLSARDGAEARKAALLAAVLFVAGSLFWFIPPLAARAQGLDLKALFPTLAQPQEGAYVAMAHRCLPTGLLGLMITGMISAAISSMDHGLNRNSGIFVRSFYLPVLRPRAKEKELVRAGRITTIVFGFLVVLLALLFSTWKNVGVLKLMLNTGVMLGIPSAVPMLWCLILRRSPDWAAWSTVLVGLTISSAISLLPTLDFIRADANSMGWGSQLALIGAHSYTIIALSNFLVCSAWYLAMASFFGRTVPLRRQQEIDLFFKTMHTPLSSREIEAEEGVSRQSRRIGKMALIWGGFMSLLLLIPNELSGRAAIAFCSLFVAGVGAVLTYTARPRQASSNPFLAVEAAPLVLGEMEEK